MTSYVWHRCQLMTQNLDALKVPFLKINRLFQVCSLNSQHRHSFCSFFSSLFFVFRSQTLWIMQRLWMVFALAETVRAAVRRDEKSHVAGNIVALYSRMCLLMNYHVHLAGDSQWTTFPCWCNFPAPTTTTHSPTLHPRLLLCTSDDSPDEI